MHLFDKAEIHKCKSIVLRQSNSLQTFIDYLTIVSSYLNCLTSGINYIRKLHVGPDHPWPGGQSQLKYPRCSRHVAKF